MATSKALVIQAGKRKQIPDADSLEVGVGIFSSGSSDLTLSPAGTNVTILAGKTLVHASGAGDIDAPYDFGGGVTNSAAEFLISGGNLQLNDSINLTLGTGDDLTLVHTGTASTITNGVGELKIENNAAAADIVLELGDAAGATNIRVNDSASAQVFNVDSNGNVIVAGDLTVNGTTTTVDSETVNIADNHLYLNNSYTADAAQTGGLIVNIDPSATVLDTYTATPPSSTTLTTVAGTNLFTAGDYMQISGTTSNDGIYRVASHAADLLTIETSGDDFIQTSIDVADTSDGTLTKVTIAVLRAGTDGVWETASSDTGPLTFSDLAAAGGNSLTQAYVVGNTLTTNATDGDFIVAGDQNMDVNIATDFSAGVTNSGGEHLFSAGNLQLNDNIVLSVGTGNDLSISHNGTNTLLASITGDLTVDNQAATGSTIMILGTDTTATDFQVQNNSAGSLLTILGSGQADFAGNLDANLGLDVIGGDFTHASGGTGNVDVSWDFSGGLVNSAGELLVSGGNVQLQDSINLTLGTGDDLTLVHNGTNSVITSAVGDLIVDNTLVTGSTILQLGTDTSATTVEVKNNTGGILFSVNGAGLVDASDGTLDVPAGTSFLINGTALTTANWTGANVDTLLDGSNADSLHVHAQASADEVVIDGMTTTGLAVGDAGYISGADTLTKTDADAEASSVFCGFNEGTVGSMTVAGRVEAAKFTTVGGSPSNGAPVYLSTGTAEGSAAGKLTATAPTADGDFVAEVGLCLNNASYAGSKTAEILIRVAPVIAL